MTALEELIELIHPPESPKGATGDWQAIESSLGVTLPLDYKEYIQSYGVGDLGEMLTIESPFGPEGYPSIWSRLRPLLRESMEAHSSEEFQLYPQTPGLLPCGFCGDLDLLSWMVTGPAETWNIVYCCRDYGYFPTEFSLMDYGVRIVDGERRMAAPDQNSRSGAAITS